MHLSAFLENSPLRRVLNFFLPSRQVSPSLSSLSSKTYNTALDVFRLMERDQCWSDRDWCALLEFVCACVIVELPTCFPWLFYILGLCWFGLVRNGILQSPSPKDQAREFRPCVNLHPRTLSPLLLSCVRLTSVSCTSNLLAQMFDFRKCTKVLLRLMLSFQGFPQNQNLETILICIVVRCFPHDNIVWIHSCDECKRSNVLKSSSHALVHSVTARASLFTNHEMSGLPIRAKCRHFRTNCQQAVDNSPTDPFSSSLNRWSSMLGVATLKNCSVFLLASYQYFPHFFAWPSMSKDHEKYSQPISRNLVAYSSSRNPGFEHISVIVYKIFAIWHSRWVQPK